MKRRDSIKTLIISSLASSLVLEGCLSKEKEIIYEKIWKYQYGRTPEEKKRDLELLNKTFFTKNEIIFYKNINDLSDKIKFYSIKDKLREKIAKNGKEKYFKLFNETKITKYFVDISLGNKTSLF